ESGTPWSFQKEWLPPTHTHAVCAVTRRQTQERREDPQSSGEILHLGRKPSDTDMATMQDQELNLHTIKELVASGLMEVIWMTGILVGSTFALPTGVIEIGPPTGTVLQGTPGLLIKHCRLHTQRVFVRLDPWDVYRKHIRLPSLMTEGRPQGTQTPDTIDHAKQTTIYILKQLQKFMVTEEDLSGSKRPKR
ncbi:hypothetical protein GOODEAATRI_025443, partial [Goodea atripinnis]